MFGNLSLAELMILIPVMAVPVFIGWAVVRAWDRRDTAARDLDEVSQEVRALSEQNMLLADELAELALESVATGRLVETQGGEAIPAPLSHPRAI